MEATQAALSDRDAALATLDNMVTIIDNDMLYRGVYTLYEPDEKALALREQGAVCGGIQACAIGSMFLASPSFGPAVKQYAWWKDDYGDFDGKIEEVRIDFDNAIGTRYEREQEYAKWPGLTLTHDCLNQAALEYAAQNNLSATNQFASAVENLFESDDMSDLHLWARKTGGDTMDFYMRDDDTAESHDARRAVGREERNRIMREVIALARELVLQTTNQ